ncbi:MAG: universal stress protein [Rothia sp. (in: high G+C Gram-positive bacteria)]|nr:universal stress protein [Rothia sp. (in: high G+C Gram-positive bacteria)]
MLFGARSSYQHARARCSRLIHNLIKLPARNYQPGETNVKTEILRPDSDVGEQMFGLARQHHIELIVLSVRKCSPMLKMLLGSVAQHILLGAECPVLSLR